MFQSRPGAARIIWNEPELEPYRDAAPAQSLMLSCLDDSNWNVLIVTI
jgi:hypothetical protein